MNLSHLPRKEHIERLEVIREAMEWINTPFIHEASVKGIGVDCSRFPLAVYARVGLISRYDPPHVSAGWNLHKDAPGFDPEIMVKQALLFTVEVREPLPGDSALFWMPHAYAHIAIVLDWPTKLVHCVEIGGVQLVDAERDPYARRYRETHPPRFFSPWRPA